MTIKLYLDEDMDVALATALRQRGFDALTTQEAGNTHRPDEQQLAFAAAAWGSGANGLVKRRSKWPMARRQAEARWHRWKDDRYGREDRRSRKAL